MAEDPRQLARDILSGKVSVEELEARQKQRAAESVTTAQPPHDTRSTPHDAPAGPVTPAPEVSPDQEPEKKPPTMSRAPGDQRQFPCSACGAKLNWDPKERALKCPYCGHVEKIDPSNANVSEHDFAAALARQVEEKTTLPDRPQEIRCPGCGAIVLIEANVRTDSCPFCATHLENAKPEQAKGQIVPHCILPFRVAQKDAINAFNQWMNSLWFAPNDLKQLANLGQLSGVYVPYWTYDSMTYTSYTGMRGDDYWVTVTYTTSENGRSVTRTRQERRTRWHYVSGEVDHFFDDVLVCASKSLPLYMVNQLEPWDLGHLQDFRGEYLAGFRTERYTVTLPEGFAGAQKIMDSEIRILCCRDIGGDHQTINTIHTQHVGVTFKHILLPIWLAVYRYRDQTYRIMVNARTGEVNGNRPYSYWKITFAVLAALAAVITIAVIFAMSQR